MQQPQTQTVYDLFNSDRVQFVVPVYQRAYVWNEHDNWAVLWDDIAEVAQHHLEDPGADPPQRHFLGPIVLDQQPFAVGGVDRRLVIDGQQRLTTLQVLLSAAKVTFEAHGATEDAGEVAGLVSNKGKAASGDGRYKVWPSRRDRTAFCAVLDGDVTGSGVLPAAGRYFRERVAEWITRDGEADGDERQARIEALSRSLDSLLYVVSINLDPTDNAQVIFETLNARGTGLGALDLVKNAALLAAERQQADAQRLNDEYWEATFEADEYWQEESRQGRLRRVRSDWFLMHWLAMHLGRVVRVDTLFDAFRKEVLRPDPPMEELIPTLCADAKTMRSFDDFEEGTSDRLFFDRLDALDTTTMLPLALLLYRSPESQSRADAPPSPRWKVGWFAAPSCVSKRATTTGSSRGCSSSLRRISSGRTRSWWPSCAPRRRAPRFGHRMTTYVSGCSRVTSTTTSANRAYGCSSRRASGTSGIRLRPRRSLFRRNSVSSTRSREAGETTGRYPTASTPRMPRPIGKRTSTAWATSPSSPTR
jgi:hypothetical protein